MKTCHIVYMSPFSNRPLNIENENNQGNIYHSVSNLSMYVPCVPQTLAKSDRFNHHSCALRPGRIPLPSAPTSPKFLKDVYWWHGVNVFFFLPFALRWSYFKSKSQLLSFWCSTWLGCNGVERKMAAYLITGVKRLWRRQKSRTPWEKQVERSY